MNKNIIIAILVLILVAVVGTFVFAQPATTTDGKVNTQINLLSGTSLKNGDQVQFELKEVKGSAVAGQSITIAYDDGSGHVQNYKIITDQNGKGFLKISGENAGKYDITITYAGNDHYNGCSIKQTITIEEGTSSQTLESTESNATANTVMYNNVSSTSSDSGYNSGSSSNSSSSSSSDTSSSSSSSSSSGSGSGSSSNSGSDSTYDPSHEYVSQLYYDEALGTYYDDFGTVHGGQYDGQEIGYLRATIIDGNYNVDKYGNPL